MKIAKYCRLLVSRVLIYGRHEHTFFTLTFNMFLKTAMIFRKGRSNRNYVTICCNTQRKTKLIEDTPIILLIIKGVAFSALCYLLCCYSYKRLVTPRRAGTAVLLCWLVSIIVGLTPMLGWNNLHNLRNNSSLINDELLVTCEFETVISMDYMVYFNFFGWVLPPLLLMLVIYVEIFYMIHKQLNKKVSMSSTCQDILLIMQKSRQVFYD